MTKTRIVALLSVLALLAAMPLATVLAQQPIPPHKFYGMVMVEGEAPPEGTMVTASVTVMTEGDDGEMMEETKEIGSAMTDAMGNYVLTTMGDAMYVGEEIMFMVGMENAMPSEIMDDGSTMMIDEPVMYTQGLISEVDLEVGEAPPRTPGGTPIVRGPAGPRGAQGPQGEQGEQGPAGETGPAGPRGPEGPAGSQGEQGEPGPKGDTGDRGPAGADGSDGADGAAGADGAQGPQGPAGPAGNDGAQGPQGSAGPAGADGADGGGALAIVALIIAIVGVVAAGGAFIAGRRG